MDWHDRYTLQAAWTRDLRAYLFERAGLDQAGHLLEVGCGTGAVLAELAELSGRASLHGLDLDAAALAECRQHAPGAHLVRGDAARLPYPNASFDLVYCHFLLLWVEDPPQVVREMRRVARPGGHVLALAEPDYTHRMDRPAALEPLGRWQAEALRRQGADPGLGNRLAEIFQLSGLRLEETGRLRSRPPGSLTPAEQESEWTVLESDLAGSVPTEKLKELRILDREAWQQRRRILDVPTYFAWGRA